MSNPRTSRGTGQRRPTQKAQRVSPSAQKFAEAVQTLVGDGPVKQRLASAYSQHLADLTENDLPGALRCAFGELQAAMTRIAPVGNETRIRASVQKMSPADASGHAFTIVKLYVELCNTLERAEPLKVVSPPRKAPRFLTGRP
jgi:hypothetical protein